MDTRSYDIAAEFCEIAGAKHLLEYLGAASDTPSEELREKLRARRKYMQGMQSNPKYKREALFLIKQSATLERVLEEPESYLKDISNRAESSNLPVLELTIKGVLAGGADLNKEQEDYLRRSALHMGVSDGTFEELLERLCNEAGVTRGTTEPDLPALDLAELASTDFYHLLGVPHTATRDEIYAAYRTQKAEARQVLDTSRQHVMMERIEAAWKVLSDAEGRERYDLSWKRTGPPARARDAGPPRGPSAINMPSVVPQTPSEAAAAQPGHPRPGRIEVLGEPERHIKVGNVPQLVDVSLRNGGEQPVGGTLRADVPWLEVYPSRLDPNFTDQLVRVTVVPDRMPTRIARGEVRIETDRGQVVSVAIHAERALPMPLILGGAAAGLLLLLGAAALLWVAVLAPSPGASGLLINVDPAASEVLLDGKPVGAGSTIYVEAPKAGDVKLEVHHPNFKDHVQTIHVDAQHNDTIDVVLAARRPMDFEPSRDPTLKKVQYDLEEAQVVMEPIRNAIDRCVEQAGSGAAGTVVKGAVRIHIDKSGLAAGVQAEGDGLQRKGTLECITRQAAAAVFRPLTQGDYATVRYDYTVTLR